MTDPVRRDEPPRSMGAKVAFVVIAGVLWALIIMIDDLIQSRETPAVATYMWQPGSLFRLNPVLETVRNLVTFGFMIGAAIYYRNRYTGARWVTEAFGVMTAVYAFGLGISAPTVRALHHLPWTTTWIGPGLVASVACGGFSVFWTWIFTGPAVRVWLNNRTVR